ncbi:hypothetical protein F2P56_015247 [Juglans regia]|uniref:CCHC-type domain-containing protein n=1 Tax=Juglans regia TaxID=51240 RepID=A0A833XEQ2_JUGRE|nr:hypothetical protein F2P56_015247 [Juglans regia]
MFGFISCETSEEILIDTGLKKKKKKHVEEQLENINNLTSPFFSSFSIRESYRSESTKIIPILRFLTFWFTFQVFQSHFTFLWFFQYEGELGAEHCVDGAAHLFIAFVILVGTSTNRPKATRINNHRETKDVLVKMVEERGPCARVASELADRCCTCDVFGINVRVINITPRIGRIDKIRHDGLDPAYLDGLCLLGHQDPPPLPTSWCKAGLTQTGTIYPTIFCGGRNGPPVNLAVVVAGNGKKKNSMKMKVVCWGCGQSGHVKKNCPRGGAGSASGSKSVNGDTDNETNVVSLSMEDDVC